MPRRVLAAVAALALAACGGGSDPGASGDRPEPIGTLSAGDPLPDVELARLDAEGTVDLGELDQPLILNFWATWCTFCVEEMPDLEEAHRALAGEVRFVGVDREDPNRDEALALAEETGVTYDLVVDPDGSFFRAVKARGMPTTVFVDAEGTIRYRHAGPLTRDQVLEFAEEHLGIDAQATAAAAPGYRSSDHRW